MKFVIYEIWTVARVVEAPTVRAAYDDNRPPTRRGLNLANWHAVAIPDPKTLKPARPTSVSVKDMLDATREPVNKRRFKA